MLEEIIITQKLGPLGPDNILKYAIAAIVDGGFPAEVPVLLLLLPLAITLIAAARYLIGIRGLGIFTPIMLAIVFLALGLLAGIVFFLAIVLVEIVSIYLLRRLRIHFMAKMALILWLVCLGLLVLLVFFASYDSFSLSALSALPFLILVLLGENLAEVHVSKPRKQALRITAETLLLSGLAFGLLNSLTFRVMAILYPEVLVLLTVLLDLFIGQFTGLRLLEYRRFRRLLKE